MADNKEALPLVAYRYEFVGVYHAPIDTLFVDARDRWERAAGWKETALTDHATAAAALSELRAELEASRLECEKMRALLIQVRDSWPNIPDLSGVEARSAASGESAEGGARKPSGGHCTVCNSAYGSCGHCG